MKKLIYLFAISILSYSASAQTETFHDFSELKIVTLDTLHLSDYAGKKVMVVNTASFCGFTPNFTELVQLDSIYGGPNFAIIGFPCNDFGAQDPFDDSTILAFARTSYNVQFQMMHKIATVSADTAEVYKWLQKRARNGVADANVSWNFNMFCIDEAGHWVRHFPQTNSPMDTAITNWIMSPSVIDGLTPNPSPKVRGVVLLGNPALHKINLTIETSVAENFSVSIFDLQGREIEKIFSGKINSELYISFTPENLSDGIYFVRVKSDGWEKTLRVCFVK
jgi:glutathione peroxidase